MLGMPARRLPAAKTVHGATRQAPVKGHYSVRSSGPCWSYTHL